MSISAPPAILARVLAFPPFASRVFAKLPVTAPYHAPHLFSEADIDDIVSDLPSLRVQDKSKPIPIISEVSGELIALSDFTGCLHSVAGDALLRRLRWDLVPKAIAIHLQNAGCTDFIVHTIATCSAERIQPAIYAHVQTLARSSMVSNSLHLRSVGNQHISQPPSRAMHSKIAIVGCSGRFPQANSMDAFWDVLSRGVDTHELVSERFVLSSAFSLTILRRFPHLAGIIEAMSAPLPARMLVVQALAAGCTMLLLLTLASSTCPPEKLRKSIQPNAWRYLLPPRLSSKLEL